MLYVVLSSILLVASAPVLPLPTVPYAGNSPITPGESYGDIVSEGDLWYSPSANPHLIQAKDTTPDGTEFLLMFDSGSLSGDFTFSLADWLAHTPKEVLAKNFQVNIAKFERVPDREIYIFPCASWICVLLFFCPDTCLLEVSAPPEDAESDQVVPNNTPLPYTFPLSKVKPTKPSGGSIKVVFSRAIDVAGAVGDATGLAVDAVAGVGSTVAGVGEGLAEGGKATGNVLGNILFGIGAGVEGGAGVGGGIEKQI
jgi:hypothetical protein